MGSLKAGDLNRRIQILVWGVTGKDSLNNPVEGFGTPVSRWASWRRATAREQLAAAEQGATVTDIFEIRLDASSAALNPKDRLVYLRRTYDIKGVTEIGYREGLRIEAVARADGGV